MLELRKAARRGDVDTVNLYKKQRDKVNAAGPGSRRTALHWAAWGGHDQVVSCLLKAAKAAVDPVDCNGDTPALLAIKSPVSSLGKKLLVIDLLLSHGADPARRNPHGETLLMYLLRLSKEMAPTLSYHREVMKNIMRKVEKNIREKAQRLNRSFTIHPNGDVIFEKIAIFYPNPQDVDTHAAGALRMRGLYRDGR
jgi:hypothetical protein